MRDKAALTRSTRDRPPAFSLIELLVVLFLVIALLALLLPAVQSAREQTRRMTCKSRLQQLGIALHSYHEVHGTFPIANLPFRFWSWQAALLPYLERQSIYNLINYEDLSYCWEAMARELIAGRPAAALQDLAPFACPSDPRALTELGSAATPEYRHRFGSYLGVSGSKVSVPSRCGVLASSRDGMLFSHVIIHGIVGPKCAIFLPDVPTTMGSAVDGASHTLFVGERGVPRTPKHDNMGWVLCGTGFDAAGEGDHVLSVGEGFYFEATPTFPPDQMLSNDGTHFWSYHPGGGNFLFVDGSVRALDYSIDFGTLQTLATRNGGDNTPSQEW